MKRYTAVLILILSVWHATAQDKYPYAVAGPGGIYVMCGNKIPMDFTYSIFRSEAGKNNWEILKVLSFSNSFDEFYRDLSAFSGNNSIYTLPKEADKGMIWGFVQATRDVDSIPFFGALPIYREALGVAFYDVTAHANTKYVYKIHKIGKMASGQDALTAEVQFPALPVDYKIRLLSQNALEDRINLRYNIASRNKLYMVRILRQNYMQGDFSEIPAIAGLSTRHDSLQAWAIDTIVHKKEIYCYVAVPYDIYGNAGRPSDTVRIVNLLYKPETVIMALRTESREKENAIAVSWKCEVPGFLRGIDVYRSTEYEKDYRRIGTSAPGDTTFLDYAVDPIKTYYYYLVVNSAYGLSERSARISGLLESNREASVPFDLEAKTETGKVKLSWRKPSGDTRGYYVMRSDDGGTTYSQLSSLIVSGENEVRFTDSLKNANSISLAYGVKSENVSYRISAMTAPVYVNPILSKPLAAPLNVIARYADGGVMVSWDDATLIDANILAYNLYRKAVKKNGGDSTEFMPVDENTYSHVLNFCFDKTVAEGTSYAYTAEAVGVNNSLSARSIPAQIKIPVFRPVSLAGITAQKTDSGNFVEWQATMQENIVSYKVYRLTDNASPLLLSTLTSDKTSFNDSTAQSGKSSFYAVTCVNAKNIESSIEEWFKAE